MVGYHTIYSQLDAIYHNDCYLIFLFCTNISKLCWTLWGNVTRSFLRHAFTKNNFLLMFSFLLGICIYMYIIVYHKSSFGGRCLPVYFRLVQGLRSMVVWHVSGPARGWAACGAGAGWHGQLPKVIHRPYSHLTTNVFQVLPWSCSTPEESFPVGMGMISCQVPSWPAQAGGREPLNHVSIPFQIHLWTCKFL